MATKFVLQLVAFLHTGIAIAIRIEVSNDHLFWFTTSQSNFGYRDGTSISRDNAVSRSYALDFFDHFVLNVNIFENSFNDDIGFLKTIVRKGSIQSSQITVLFKSENQWGKISELKTRNTTLCGGNTVTS